MTDVREAFENEWLLELTLHFGIKKERLRGNLNLMLKMNVICCFVGVYLPPHMLDAYRMCYVTLRKAFTYCSCNEWIWGISFAGVFVLWLMRWLRDN